MTLLLVFPPLASPAYVPLGLGILAGAARALHGPESIRLLDLNIEAWRYGISLDPHGERLLRFMKGHTGDFHDPEAYRLRAGEWTAVKRRMEDIANLAGLHLGGGGDYPVLDDLLGDQVRRILEMAPDTVGISILFPKQLVFGSALARRLRAEAPALRIVLGGATLSFVEVEDLLAACPYIDGAVLGEGEPALAALCSSSLPHDTPGLVSRREGRIHRCAPVRDMPLDRSPPADFTDLDLSGYLTPTPVLPILSGRGCLWRRCRFCSHNSSFGVFRERPAELVVDEMESHVRRLGVRHFHFADPYMDPAHLEALSASILRRGLDVHFHFLGKPDAAFDERLLGLLARAGCRWISWGIESGSQRLLDLAGKGTDVREIRRVLARCHAAGISNLLLMVFGLPGSTDEDLDRTFNFLDEAWDVIDSATASTFVLYADSPFGRRPEKYGIHVTGREVQFHADGRPVRSRRMTYKEVAADGTHRPPRGSLEADAWERRRRWLPARFLEDTLYAEHYLLHASHRYQRGPRGLSGVPL